MSIWTAIAFCGFLGFIAAVAVLGSWLADEIEHNERTLKTLPRAGTNGGRLVGLASDKRASRVDTFAKK